MKAILILLIVYCSFQDYKFEYKKIPKKYEVSSTHIKKYRTESENIKKSSYDITNILPENYVKDGSCDYTKYLQEAINNFDIVLLPNFPVLINKSGLSLKSNSKIIFDKKSKLIMDKNAEETYQLLRLFNIENVTLYFPTLVGDRNVHTGIHGEWGMGISIMGSSNITIINPKVSNCWGDGIYLGHKITTNKNIKIYYPVLDNNRRNGMSIISVDGLLIEGAVIANTNGTMPECAIDIEPNNNNEEIDNIIINNTITFNNKRYGISIYTNFFRGNKEKNINVKLKNHVDDGSISGFIIDKQTDINKKPLRGKILITAPVWLNNHKQVVIENEKEYSPEVIILKE